MRRLACFFLSALLTLGGEFAGAAMHPVDAQKVERFKQRIGFDRAFQAESAAQAVRVAWPDPLQAPGIGTSWRVADDTVWRAEGGAAREWILRRGAETVSVLIFVAEQDPNAARQFLLRRASDNMMMEVPYEPGPPGLGTFAVHAPTPDAPALLWVYRTVCFHLQAQDSAVDLAAIAKWLQAKAESGVIGFATLGAAVPGTVRVSTARTRLGQPVTLELVGAGRDDGRFMLDLEYDRARMEVVAQRGLSALVRGLVAGRSSMQVVVIDRTTLLSARFPVELEFAP